MLVLHPVKLHLSYVNSCLGNHSCAPPKTQLHLNSSLQRPGFLWKSFCLEYFSLLSDF